MPYVFTLSEVFPHDGKFLLSIHASETGALVKKEEMLKLAQERGEELFPQNLIIETFKLKG